MKRYIVWVAGKDHPVLFVGEKYLSEDDNAAFAIFKTERGRITLRNELVACIEEQEITPA